MTLAISPSTCSSRTGTWPASPASLPVSTLATISPSRHQRPDATCARTGGLGRASRYPIHPFRTASGPCCRAAGARGHVGTTCGRRLANVRPAPAQGGVVGNREIEPKQAQHAGDEPFGLAQGQVEDEPQDQHQLDCQVRIERLTARRGPSRCMPSGNGRLVEPERQVALCASALHRTAASSGCGTGSEALGPVRV
jgi:hypothetical protein